MRIVVLGGTGFIGRHVVERLMADGHDVCTFGRNPAASPIPGVDHMIGDLSDQHSLSRALAGAGAVYHLVSTTVPGTAEADPVADVQGNLVGTLHLLAEMQRQGISRLIYMSSGGAIYGETSQLPTPESHAQNPIGSYGIVKLAIEGFLARQTRQGLIPVILRPSNAYGPWTGQPRGTGFVNQLLQCLSIDKPFGLVAEGAVVRDFLHVRDLAELCRNALSASAPVTVNAGSGQGRSLRDVIALAERITGRKARLFPCPARDFDPPASVLDIRQAARLFDWHPRIAFEDGLAETWAWMQTQVSRDTSS